MIKPICVLAEVSANLRCELYEITQDNYGKGQYTVKLARVHLIDLHDIIKSFSDAGFYCVDMNEAFPEDGSDQDAIDLILQEMSSLDVEIYKMRYKK